MSARRSFSIGSSVWGYDPARGRQIDARRLWFRVRVYDDVDELRAAAARFGRDPLEHFATCEGVCQVFDPPTPPSGLVGVIRFLSPIEHRIVVHELGHAAMGIFRHAIDRSARFGRSTASDREEAFCYILDDLAYEFFALI